MSILISACLLGNKVRYNGKSSPCNDPRLASWLAQGLLIPVCPEVDGGLSTPRPPAEIPGGGGPEVLTGLARVCTNEGADVTQAFIAGAEHARQRAVEEKVCCAILQERSPSCGSRVIYDGTFSGRLIPGCGVTTALLRQQGIPVFNEQELDDVARLLAGLPGH